MKTLLNRLARYETLSKLEAREVLINIAEGKYNQSQIASFLTVFTMRTIALQELEGFREALLELCISVDLSDFNPVDLCGTGGDGKDTFNISSLASFVTAGSGVYVAKHGNHGVSSNCGSSDVLEFLGIRFSNNPDFLRRSIELAGICILHAPLFHPAMKNVAPIRRDLGTRTFFNMLGPLVNPASPNNQMVGVFSLELARLYDYLYEKTDKNYTLIYGLDGYDEISLTGPTRILTQNSTLLIQPEDFGVQALNAKEIAGGGSISSSAEIFMNVLEGRGTLAQNNVTCANAGMALATALGCTFKEGFKKAQEALTSKKALKAFETLKKISAE